MITKRLTEEIADVLNKYSVESASDTPDFILAAFLTNCLQAFNEAVCERARWYAGSAAPAAPPGEAEAPFEFPYPTQRPFGLVVCPAPRTLPPEPGGVVACGECD